MDLLLGVAVVALFIHVGVPALVDAFATWQMAKAGEWQLIEEERARRHARRLALAAAWAARRRLRNLDAGGTGDYRPGFHGYARDVWLSFWERKLAERIAARQTGGQPQPSPDLAVEPVGDPPTGTFEEADDPPYVRGVGGDQPVTPPWPADEPWEPYAGDRQPVPPPTPWPWSVPDPGVPRYAVEQPTTPPDDPNGAPSMTAPMVNDAATNEAVRQNLEQIEASAARLAEAIAVAEAERARLAALAAANADVIGSARFDAGATAAAYEIADTISVATLSEWHEKADACGAAARAGQDSLEKYRDAEDLVASQQVDGRTLDPVAS